MSPKQKIKTVSNKIIRQLFNENNIYQRMLSGEFTTSLHYNNHLDKPPRGEPFCTHSQMVWYFDSHNKPVALVHQYKRKDGTIGASGLPDPKYLIIKNITYKTKC